MNAVSCTTPTPVSETLPPVECAPWCEDGSGHTDVLHPEDQWCHSEYAEVSLSRYALVVYNDGNDNLSRRREVARTYLAQENGGRPYMHVGLGDSVGIELTPAEALELARSLTLFASAAQAQTR